jgi:hypothetical protein
MTTKATRAKLSTTVAPENYEYLTALVKSGKAGSLAEAVDEAVERLRRSENRIRLARATTSYYESLSPEALKEEEAIGGSMRNASQGVDFDDEL